MLGKNWDARGSVRFDWPIRGVDVEYRSGVLKLRTDEHSFGNGWVEKKTKTA